MIDYTISDTLTLPSEGKVYEGKVKNPTVRLRSMTTEHEMMRLSHSDYSYKNLCTIIDDCIVDDLGISSYDLCLGDYQAILFKLRSVTYGPEYKLSSICPACGAILEDTINLDNLPVLSFDESIFEAKEFDLPRSGQHIVLRLSTPRVLDTVDQQIKLMKKNSKDNIDQSLIYNIAGSIETVDGKPFRFNENKDWLKNLPGYDMNFLLSKIEKLNATIRLDTELENHCDKCGFTYKSSLRMTSEFFRPTID